MIFYKQHPEWDFDLEVLATLPLGAKRAQSVAIVASDFNVSTKRIRSSLRRLSGKGFSPRVVQPKRGPAVCFIDPTQRENSVRAALDYWSKVWEIRRC